MAVAATGVAAAGLTAVASPASALDNGPLEVKLAECSPQQSDNLVPDCSYATLNAKLGGKFIYTKGTWSDGSYTDGAVAFPAAGQKWASVSAVGGTKVTLKGGDITGQVAADGTVTMTMPYEVNLDGALVDNCVIQGTAQLTSAGKEGLQGASSGANLDPATGKFAVVTTAQYGVTFADVSRCGTVTGTLAPDILTTGLGFYLTGTMAPPSADAGPAQVQAQAAKIKPTPPKRIKPKGVTRVLKYPVITEPGQEADAKLSWSTKKNAKGKNARYAKATVTEQGGLSIKTTGKAKRLYVKLTVSAPAMEGYKAYKFTKKWTVKR